MIREGDMIKEVEIREERRCCADGLKDGARDHHPRKAGASRSRKRQKNPEETSLVDTLTLAQSD